VPWSQTTVIERCPACLTAERVLLENERLRLTFDCR